MKLIAQRGKPFEYVLKETGQELFSVSQIRREMYDWTRGIDPRILEAARLRGKVLHARLWRLLGSRLDLCPVPAIIQEYAGYCSAMDEWAHKNDVIPVRLEDPSVNLKLGYAGCPDMQCRYARTSGLKLGDLKTGEEAITDVAQLLAYDAMDGYKSDEQFDLYVHADGTYDEVWVTKKDRLDQWPWFLSALGVLTGRRNHGIHT